MKPRRTTYFRANLSALRDKDPVAAKAVLSRNLRSGAAVECLSAKNGMPTMRVAAPGSDAAVFFHSAYDPVAEAGQWADGLDFSKDCVVVLLGFGMGYYADEILERITEDSSVLFVERDVTVLREAMKRRDLQHIFRSSRAFFAVGPDDLRVSMMFRNLYDPRKEPIPLVASHIPSTLLFPGFYGKMPAQIRDDFMWLVKNIGTIVSLSPMWHSNSLHNLPAAARSPGVLPLRGLFKGRPAIVVAAGPSLNKNIHHIKKAVGKALIVSVGTALKPLQKHGIKPHIAVTVDGSFKTYPQFDGVDLEDIYLVSNLSAYPKVVGSFPDRCFIWDNTNPMIDWLGSFTGEKGSVAAGGTVSITAMDVAALCGCGPVITVGLDMSFTEEGRTHADETIHAKRQVEVDDLRRVPGNYAETVPTTTIFYTYLRSVEQYVRSRPDNVFVNATEGGARIEGMQLMHLDEAVEAHCTTPFSVRDHVAAAWLDGRPGDLDALLQELSGILARFRRVERLGRTAAALCNDLVFHSKVVYDDTEKTALAILKRLERIDAAILGQEKQQALISMVMRPIFYTVEAKVCESEKGYSDAIRVHLRSRKMYEGIVATSAWTRRMIKEARKQIRKHHREETGRMPVARAS